MHEVKDILNSVMVSWVVICPTSSGRLGVLVTIGFSFLSLSFLSLVGGDTS